MTLWAVLGRGRLRHVGKRTGERFVGRPTDGIPSRVPITNIYPYGRNGQLLHDVFYEQAGTPLMPAIETPIQPTVRPGKNGTMLQNVFDRYFQPGRTRWRNPDGRASGGGVANEGPASRRSGSSASTVSRAVLQSDEGGRAAVTSATTRPARRG